MPHFPPNAYFCTMQPSEELKNHIETEIIPRYESFDARTARTTSARSSPRVSIWRGITTSMRT